MSFDVLTMSLYVIRPPLPFLLFPPLPFPPPSFPSPPLPSPPLSSPKLGMEHQQSLDSFECIKRLTGKAVFMQKKVCTWAVPAPANHHY